MKVNKSLPFILLILLVGCSKGQGPHTLVSQWNATHASYINVVERKLASSSLNQGQCLKDVYSVDLLRSQVKELEAQFASSQKVSGSWKHLNLANLPVPQANFLQRFGNKIGDLSQENSLDYSSCTGVPCIFNKIYGKEEEALPGYVHYLWYLRFGNMLSADNLVPEQSSRTAGTYNNKLVLLQDYLWTDQELYGIWRLSLMLKDPYTNLRYLEEIQRIPGKERFENKSYAQACGLASSTGWIILTSQCLWMGSRNIDSGSLYESIAHEMTHQIDFQLGRGSRSSYRSHRPDYMAFAGMTEQEYMDANGNYVMKWMTKPDFKYVTDYAKTNPQENFAESLAYFRVDGDTTLKKLSPDHATFISQNFFQGQSFDSLSLLKSYLTNYSADTNQEVFKAVLDCSKETDRMESTYFRASDFSNPVMPTLLSCLSTEGEKLADRLKAHIMVSEPDGCNSFNSSSANTAWKGIVRDHLVKIFDQNLKLLYQDKDYLARVQSFYDELSNKKIAQDAFVNCYEEMNEEDCYKNEVKQLSGNLPPDLSQMYLDYHSYAGTKLDTLKTYQTIVDANLELIHTEGNHLWQSCLSLSPHDDEPPTGSLFTLGDSYLVSSIYNCLNAQVPETLKKVVRGIQVNGRSVEHPKEELLLGSEVLPKLVLVLKDNYKEAQDKEVSEAFDFMAKDDGQLRKKVLSDFSWVTNIMDTQEIEASCKGQASKLIPMNLLYNLKKDLFSDFLSGGPCANISSTPEFKNWVDRSKDKLSENMLSGLDDKMMALGTNQAQVCVKQYPVDTMMNKLRYKQKREACLLDQWPLLEEKLYQETLKDPVVLKFKLTPDSIKNKIQMNRRRLQLRIFKENFQ